MYTSAQVLMNFLKRLLGILIFISFKNVAYIIYRNITSNNSFVPAISIAVKILSKSANDDTYSIPILKMVVFWCQVVAAGITSMLNPRMKNISGFKN